MVNCRNIPDGCRVLTEEGLYPAEKSGDGFSWKDVELGIRMTDRGLDLCLHGGETPVRAVALRWLGEWDAGTLFSGDAIERGYGDFEWRGLNLTRLMPWYFAAHAREKTDCYGVMTGPDAYAIWQADGNGVTLWLDTRCGGKGVILNGKAICPGRICQEHYEGITAFRAIQRFCRLLCDAPLLPKGPVYGSNNWYYAMGNTSREEFLATARETAELSTGFTTCPYVVMDDGWQELAEFTGAAGRPYRRGNPRFPDMQGIAESVLDMGCLPGLWFRPALNHDQFWKGAWLQGKSGNIMDLSVPSGLDAVAEDVSRFVSWGYKLLKYDFVTCDLMGLFVKNTRDFMRVNGWALADRSVTNAMMIRNLCGTIRKNAGDAILIACNVPSHLAAGEAHIQRGGDDTNAREWYRTIVMGVNTLAFRLPQHNAFYAMDADCVGIVRAGIPWELNRRFLDLIARSGTPLFVSPTPGIMTEEMRADICAAFERVNAGMQDLEPLDWMENSLPTRYLSDGEEVTFSWWPEEGFEYPGEH